MRHILIFGLAALLAATPAFAQQQSLQTQIDAGVAAVSRVVNGLANQIVTDAQQIEMQRRQIEALQQQLAAANAKTGCPAAGERSE